MPKIVDVNPVRYLDTRWGEEAHKQSLAYEPITDEVKRQITLNVSQDILGRAVPGDPWCCAISLCAKEALGAMEAYATPSSVYVLMRRGSKLVGKRYSPSASLIRDVIHPLDEGRETREDFYDLLPVAPSKRLGEAPKRRNALAVARAEGKAKPAVPHAAPRRRVSYNRLSVLPPA